MEVKDGMDDAQTVFQIIAAGIKGQKYSKQIAIQVRLLVFRSLSRVTP